MGQIRLEIEQVLQADAANILAARDRARTIHHTRDIGAAGDEVEQTVRDVLTRKLPAAYYVGHGHIVDEQLATSSQMDIIIADNTHAPILFRTTNDTEYFPYESVYAIGEVKTSYQRQQQPIHAFVDRLKSLQSTLRRLEATPPKGRPVTPLAALAPYYGNPLFSFMLFADANDVDVEELREFYYASGAAMLPNVVCFLDKGVIVHANVRYRNGPLRLNIMPKYHRDGGSEINRWVFNTGTPGNEQAYSFGVLYFMLVTHLGQCVLRPPNLLAYLAGVFGTQGTTLIFGPQSFAEGLSGPRSSI